VETSLPVFHGGEQSCIQNLKERDGFEDKGLDGRITVKWVLKKYDRECVLNSSVKGQGQLAGCCEHGNELSHFMKCGQYPD